MKENKKKKPFVKYKMEIEVNTYVEKHILNMIKIKRNITKRILDLCFLSSYFLLNGLNNLFKNLLELLEVSSSICLSICSLVII